MSKKVEIIRTAKKMKTVEASKDKSNWAVVKLTSVRKPT